jgi:hypothetical protein
VESSFLVTAVYRLMIKKKKVIKEITDKIKKIAHAPVQTWKRWTPNDLFRGWFSALGKFKTLIGTKILVSRTYLIVPCLFPLVLWSIRIIIEATIKRKTAAHIMMLWKYRPLNEDDAL